jgi:hypothetical protein
MGHGRVHGGGRIAYSIANLPAELVPNHRGHGPSLDGAGTSGKQQQQGQNSSNPHEGALNRPLKTGYSGY